MAILQGFLQRRRLDVAALFEQLKQEVRRSGAAPGEAAAAPTTAGGARRGRAALAGVGRPEPAAAPGVRGGLGTPAKAVLRKLMRWYVEPLAYDQRSFNAAALRLIDDLEARVASSRPS